MSYNLSSTAFINNNLGSITLYTGFPVDWNSEKTRPTHEKTDDWNTYRNVFLDIDGCLRPSYWAGLARKEQLGQCAWISFPGEAPAMANPYALEAKKMGKSVDEMRKFFEDHNPLKNINNPFDSTNSMVDPDPSSASNPWAPTDSSFTTANTVDSGAGFSTLATTDDVSAPPADEAKFFIPSNGVGGGLFALRRRRLVPAKRRNSLQMKIGEK